MLGLILFGKTFFRSPAAEVHSARRLRVANPSIAASHEATQSFTILPQHHYVAA